MPHKIKFLKPFESQFSESNAEELSEAACDLLANHANKALFIRPDDAGRNDGDTTYFALMADDTGHEFVARYFYGGIGRKGGIKPPRNPLQCASMAEVETRLGLPAGGLDCEWDGEQSAEDAWEAKLGRPKQPA